MSNPSTVKIECVKLQIPDHFLYKLDGVALADSFDGGTLIYRSGIESRLKDLGVDVPRVRHMAGYLFTLNIVGPEDKITSITLFDVDYDHALTPLFERIQEGALERGTKALFTNPFDHEAYAPLEALDFVLLQERGDKGRAYYKVLK